MPTRPAGQPNRYGYSTRSCERILTRVSSGFRGGRGSRGGAELAELSDDQLEIARPRRTTTSRFAIWFSAQVTDSLTTTKAVTARRLCVRKTRPCRSINVIVRGNASDEGDLEANKHSPAAGFSRPKNTDSQRCFAARISRAGSSDGTRKSILYSANALLNHSLLCPTPARFAEKTTHQAKHKNSK